MSKKVDPKKTMLLHSEAKVDFYKKYLERYLRILCSSKYIHQVNIFDVFSGTGIYENGKKGSPIAAFDTIKDLPESNRAQTQIRLFVNDSNSTKVQSVQTYIDQNNADICEVEYTTDSADEMFQKVYGLVSTQPRDCRSLIFIDPYGYKEINGSTLSRLLENGLTEIILFLPISHMQRFTTKAVDSDEKPYLPLKNFVNSFFPDGHEIRTRTIPQVQYIDLIKDALKFGRYFSASYYIERDSSNYFALFFVTSKIFGLEKILEVKWKLDENEGRGFRQPSAQIAFPLFLEQEKQLWKNENYSRLEQRLMKELASPKDNMEIYEIVIGNEFLPKHATEVFANWTKNLPGFKAINLESGETVKGNNFCISWEWYNPQKNSSPKTRFTIEA